jgi:hypothetical protein
MSDEILISVSDLLIAVRRKFRQENNNNTSLLRGVSLLSPVLRTLGGTEDTNFIGDDDD